MRDDIVTPVQQYAEGQIELEEAIDMLRQVTPADYEFTDSPYANEYEDHEGGYTDLLSACMIYDCTADELGHFRRALFGTPIGPQDEGEPEPEFDESYKPSLEELMAPEEDEREIAPPTVIPGEESETSDETPDDESEVAKHEEHNQKDHGIWARSRKKVKERREGKDDPSRHKIVADARAKKKERYRRRLNAAIGSRIRYTGAGVTAQVLKHRPGGQDHDQSQHGNWSSGPSQPQTTASGGGATLDSGGPTAAPSPAAQQGAPATQPDLPEEMRAGGRTSRPMTLDALAGQEKVRERLGIMVDAARQRGTPMDHVILSGPPGLGKTTIAKALANEMDAEIRVTTGPSLKNREQLIDILSEMNDGDVLFVDEIHALPRAVEETMLPLLEEGEIDMKVGESIRRVKAPNITVIGATTNPEGVVKPLRDRFGTEERLSFYKPDELAEIVQMTSGKSGFDISPASARAIAMRSRGTPRMANRLVRRVSDFATARGVDITPEVVNDVLGLWDIDSRGLTSEDRRVMSSLRDIGGGGINALSAATGLDEGTIASVVEPYLMRQGFIQRGPRGRQLTQAGLTHLEEFGDDELVSKRIGILPVFSAPVEIAKADTRKNLVFGWANVVIDENGQVEDHQGHMIDVEDLEDAAYGFVVKYRKTGDMHKGDAYGDLVESLVVTQDKIDSGGFPPDMLGKWWVGFRVPDEDWERVERGERSMFSIQGRARLEPV